MAGDILPNPSTKALARRGVLAVFLIGSAVVVASMAGVYNKGVRLRRYGVAELGSVTGLNTVYVNSNGHGVRTHSVTYAYPIGSTAGVPPRILTGRYAVTTPEFRSL